MGDGQKGDLRVDFDRRVKLTFLGSKVTTDAGLLAYRELDETFGLTEVADGLLSDSRLGKNKQHSLVALLRQSIYSRLAGYEDVNDAERLSVDPAMRHVLGGRASQPEKQAASTSEVGRFETEMLCTKSNLTALVDLSGKWIDRIHLRKPPKKLILDMDSSLSETYGQQEGAAYNGHFGCTCYHPLFLFNQDGDLERVMLRRGNHASAKFWRRVLLPVVARYRHLDIAYLLTRPVGRPPKKPIVLYAGFLYRAASWHKYRRVVAKVEWHCEELYPRVGFNLTNIWKAPEQVVRFYNGRGTAEQWIKEGKNAVKWTKLSCRTFKDNQTRLQLFALAYSLANFLRRLALPPAVRHWSLTTLREKLVKIGGKVVRHAGYVTFQLAEVAVPRKLFRAILRRIAKLRLPLSRASPT